MLKILYSFISIVAMLFILVISYGSGGIIGFILAISILTVIAISNSRKKGIQPVNILQSNNKNLNNTSKFKLSTMVAVIIIGSIPIIGVGSFFAKCQFQRVMADKNFKPTLEKFNNLYIIKNNTEAETIVSKYGDCFDSLPSMSASKTQAINLTGEKAVSTVSNALKAQGYTVSKIKYYEDKCVSRSEFYATSPGVTFRITISSNPKIPGCFITNSVADKSQVNNEVMHSVRAITN